MFINGNMFIKPESKDKGGRESYQEAERYRSG
jgi:hypothetical protein